MKRLDDLLFAVGGLSVAGGCGLLSVAAGLIVGGALLMLAGYLVARQNTVSESGSRPGGG